MLHRTVDSGRSHRGPAHAETQRCRLQRSRHAGVGAMTTNDEAAFTEDVSEPCPDGRGVTIDDFVAYLPTHSYIFTPCREIWSGVSVNVRLPRVPVLTRSGAPKRGPNGNIVTLAPTTWLDRNRAVEQMTWC